MSFIYCGYLEVSLVGSGHILQLPITKRPLLIGNVRRARSATSCEFVATSAGATAINERAAIPVALLALDGDATACATTAAADAVAAANVDLAVAYENIVMKKFNFKVYISSISFHFDKNYSDVSYDF